ncbi:VIT family-domain-containing protein [Cladorrhinum samala]|uniref:VIT family-domain-containing protein n=1 Tax=Cladorrhinum samala TaxID=585594 RepID=A0AAV9HTW2_9PEZI|nr:VIT family-domain-containing protein [Cladorrhinum samala]
MAPLNQHLNRLMGIGREASPKSNPDGSSLPLYEPLRIAPSIPRESSSSADTSIPYSPSSTTGTTTSASPHPKLSLSAFLSNLTLGFADGLTVPFALTAGLSSLGSTKTVIYAGMAEICAGSISMGIGGYLAARGEDRHKPPPPSSSSSSSPSSSSSSLASSSHHSPSIEGLLDPELESELEEDEKSSTLILAAELRLQVEGMNLPAELEEEVLRHLRAGAAGEPQPALMLLVDEEQQRKESPVLAGVSVSLGYLLGGALPLFPYFFLSADEDPVRKGLAASFVVCVIALFVFGFGKEFVLGYDAADMGTRTRERTPVTKWSSTKGRLKACAWEGAQMVVLGSVAAGAAVLCVRAFEGWQ